MILVVWCFIGGNFEQFGWLIRYSASRNIFRFRSRQITERENNTSEGKTVLLYHTGFDIIRHPDVRHGRGNADFGQGFYLTANVEFARRWARKREDCQTIVNAYDLDPDGLAVLRFQRDENWFRYIFANRSGRPDTVSADVVIGPIANDTIYDTLGIITSGFLTPSDAMKLLMIGPEYQQIALKTERAAEQLRWISADVLSPEEVAGYRSAVAAEEDAYQML